MDPKAEVEKPEIWRQIHPMVQGCRPSLDFLAGRESQRMSSEDSTKKVFTCNLGPQLLTLHTLHYKPKY